MGLLISMMTCYYKLWWCYLSILVIKDYNFFSNDVALSNVTDGKCDSFYIAMLLQALIVLSLYSSSMICGYLYFIKPTSAIFQLVECPGQLSYGPIRSIHFFMTSSVLLRTTSTNSI